MRQIEIAELLITAGNFCPRYVAALVLATPADQVDVAYRPKKETGISPEDIARTFDLIDGIWVTSAKCAIPVTAALRQSLIELALLRQTRDGQETKAEMLYEYFTGPHFRQRLQSIVEAFSTMKDDLAKEKRAIQVQWAKREKQLERVLGATAGMYGDLHGIAGQTIKEIEGLSLLVHDDESASNPEMDGGGEANESAQ